MPGPSSTESRWAPTTTVRSSRPVGVSAMHVRRRRRDGLGVHGDPHGDRLAARDPVVELLADGERRPDDRDVVLRRVERAGDDAEPVVVRVVVALVEDDDGDGARSLCGLGLLAERAGAALDERDRARREPGVVGCRAAARRAARRRDRDPAGEGQRRREVARAGVVHGRVLAVEPLDVGLGVGRDALERARVEDELVVGEVLDRDLVARLGQEVGHVVDGSGVAGRARRAGPTVGVGDRLERGFVLHDPGDGDRVPQCGRVGPDCGRAERRQGQRKCCCCEQQEFPRQEMPPCICDCLLQAGPDGRPAGPLSAATVAHRLPRPNEGGAGVRRPLLDLLFFWS